MPLITWNASLMVNLEPVDSQHQRLVAWINQLFDAMAAGKGRAVLGDVLDGLVDYTQTHFATEERLMVAHAYPDYANHKLQHDRFAQQIQTLHTRFQGGEPVITVKVTDFLKDWLSRHILQVDKQLATYLAQEPVGERGVLPAQER